MTSMFFSGWEPLLRTLCIGGLSYVAVVLFLRVSGKRTLSKMNAFDFIVTVALGSTLSAAFVSNTVDLAQAVLAIAYLIALQYLVAWGSVRSERFQGLIKAAPVLSASNGSLHKAVMGKERMTEEEILAGIRAQGFADINEVGAVILETDGTLSVLPAGAVSSLPQLPYVQGPGP